MRICYLIAFLLLVKISIAQDNSIGIGLVSDNQTQLSKSFALFELLSENPISNGTVIMQPKMVDFVFNSTFGIEGVFYENNVNLKLYYNGKKIKDIKCNNDWETILSTIAVEVEKVSGFKLSKKYHRISEGSQAAFYNRQVVENLPGNITIQVPANKIISYKSFKANIINFKAKNAYSEITELYGKFSNTNINEILLFKSNDVPENFKSTIKPFVYPISKTMTYGLKMLGYGGYFLEQKDYNAALNCFYTSINNSKEILASAKEVAILRSFSFKNISDIYAVAAGKQELSRLFLLGYDLNNDFSNSKSAQTSNENYYSAISKVKSLCENVEANRMRARSARGMMIMGAVSNGLSASSGSLNDLGFDVSSLTTSLSASSSQSATLQNESVQFFSQLSQTKDLVKAESFIVDGLDLKAESNYVSSEVLYYLMMNPLEIKRALLDYANDKPRLNTLLTGFYAANESEKPKLIQDIYSHFYKIEMVITGLEARGKIVEEKYKLNF